MTLAQGINDFVDDQPIDCLIEAPVPGEDD